MYFDLDNDQKAIRETVSTFLADHLDGQRALALSDAGGLNAELWQAASALGVNAVLAPAVHDGLGMDLLTLAVIAEELGRAAAPLPVTNNALAAWLIGNHGSDAVRQTWMAPVISGQAVAAFALGENDAFPELASWSLHGNQAHGQKTNVEWGPHASLLVVGLAGGALGVVAVEDAGVTIEQVPALDRTRPLANVTFTGAAVETLTSDPGVARQILDALSIIVTADAFGAAVKALSLSVGYAKERVQFGQPIGSFQGIKHQLADMAVDIEPSRALYWYAAHAWDAIPHESERAAALAKAHICNLAVKTARRAVEVHGGIGYTWEYPLHLWLKRAMYDRAAMGGPAASITRAANLADWGGAE